MKRAYPREHGTVRGYRQHLDRDEKPCDACKKARRPTRPGEKISPEAVEHNRQRSRERQRKLPMEVRQANNLWRSHGLTPAGKQEILNAQDGKCYLCGDELAYDAAVVDHDHACCRPISVKPTVSCAYCRRGLACERCNHVVGHAGDDPERLVRIAASLAAVLPIVRARIDSKPRQLALDSAAEDDEPGTVAEVEIAS